MASDENGETCPKCGWRRDSEARACTRCGLTRDRWPAFLPPEESPSVIDAFHACERDWQDPAAHARALDAAALAGQLPALARRYRERLRAEPDDATARACLDKIGVLVEMSARTQVKALASSRASRALWYFVYGLSTLLLSATLWVLFKVMTHR